MVFFAKYKGGFSQKIEKTEIVGEFLRERGEMKGEYYIFEPSPKEVLEFFEHEMIGILFHQTILEHQLARYSARVLAMFQATEKAKKMKEEIKIAVAKFERFLKNKKQIELFGGMPTWKISEK
ncbi:F0F1 ATP synthase subunit gamma [Candidatus Parcubacteria bacterium]|nr:F0F1 ATP synthase subunit gamma [Candidatus Parcubacteria bacterium]